MTNLRSPWFDFVTQNIQSVPLMTQSHVVEDAERTRRDSDMSAFQEITPERYEQAIQDLNTPNYRAWVPEGDHGGCCLAWPRRNWALVDRGRVQLHEAHAQISYARFLIWARIRHVETGAEFVEFTFHFVAGVWDGDKNDPYEALRANFWQQDREVTRDFMQKWVERGIPLLGGGDINRAFAHPLGPPVGTQVSRRKVNYICEPWSIDPILYVHGKDWRWQVDSNGTEELSNRHSDHAGRKARLRLIYRQSA